MYRYNLGIKFEEVAKKYAKNIALKFSKSHTISYDELNKWANQIARLMLDRGIKQKDVVCISGNKISSTFACMIACLKIGAIYSIFDPESPVERLRKIFKVCMPKILFLEPELGQRLQEIIEQLDAAVINNSADELDENLKQYEAVNLSVTRTVTGSNPAYIMYTSGSTGFPKGAVMTHNNVLNLLNWSIETYKIASNDIMTNVNPLYFDNTVFDFYSSLFSGACLVPFPKETVTDLKLLVNMIDELKCTSWFSVPTLLLFLQTMKALNKDNMLFIKRFIFGGEGYPKSKLKKLYDLYSDRAEFFNVSGPTECTCICSSYKLAEADFADIQGFPPLGEIINNFSYLIVDENDKCVPAGEIGELCLLGPNVGMGYYNDPERTQLNFVQNPYNSNYYEIMYKTGDMVNYNPEDDKVYIMGRKDNQVKHMGYRIELEEIETALSCLDYISQAAVLHGSYRELSRLVAIVSTKSKIDETGIRNDLKQIIPDYMIPTTFHMIRELPRNPNGKVDRRKLTEIYLAEDRVFD
jgi:D-alanine--poly(phosphoribitol) ligase subunit 1